MVRCRRIAVLATLTLLAAAAPKPPAVGDAAPDFRLTALGGDEVKLAELTNAGPVVLVVLRGYPGYQCPYCTKQVADFLAHAAAFKAAGASVAFVYPGPAANLTAHAKEFAADRTFPANFHLLLDPAYAFTTAYRLRWDQPHETAYPSTFVIDGHGKVTFANVGHGHGGRTSAADTVKAVGGHGGK